jgi:hypothetical protein
MRDSLPNSLQPSSPVTQVCDDSPRRDRVLDASTITIDGRVYTATEIKLRLRELDEFAETVSQQHEVGAKLLEAAQRELSAIRSACLHNDGSGNIEAEHILFEAAADAGTNFKRDHMGDYVHSNTFHQFAGWLKARRATPAISTVIHSHQRATPAASKWNA